jgi:hypothetical protein
VTSTPPTCALVGASITTREFADHLQEERTRLEGFLGELQDRAMAHHIACLEVGIGSTAPAFHGSGLPDALARMAQSLLATATFLDADLPAQGRAVQRALDGRRPAKRGAVKDAIMIEEYLALARELRAGQYTPTLVFLSSNPNDFCVGTGRHLHPDLAGDFQATNLGFGMTWPAAVGLLGL